MNKTSEETVAVDPASVSRLAYQLWENAGRPVARDLEFWLAAEAQVRAVVQRGPSPSSRTEPTPSVSDKERREKMSKISRGGIKKTWPKPYPGLPKF